MYDAVLYVTNIETNLTAKSFFLDFPSRSKSYNPEVFGFNMKF